MCRQLVARLARKRPSPLVRGNARIWAAGALYAIGQQNFLFDRSQQPHLTSDQLAAQLGVAKTTMAHEAALISKMLNLGACEPDLQRDARANTRSYGLPRSTASSSTPACCQPTCKTRLAAAA